MSKGIIVVEGAEEGSAEISQLSADSIEYIKKYHCPIRWLKNVWIFGRKINSIH